MGTATAEGRGPRKDERSMTATNKVFAEGTKTAEAENVVVEGGSAAFGRRSPSRGA